MPIIDYEIPANSEVLKNTCTRASATASDMPLGAVWKCATKAGFDKGSSMVDGMLVTDIIKTGFVGLRAGRRDNVCESKWN